MTTKKFSQEGYRQLAPAERRYLDFTSFVTKRPKLKIFSTKNYVIERFTDFHIRCALLQFIQRKLLSLKLSHVTESVVQKPFDN